MTKRKKITVKVAVRICKTCAHEENYHKGLGFLTRLACLVTGCRCRRWEFGRTEMRDEEKWVDDK